MEKLALIMLRDLVDELGRNAGAHIVIGCCCPKCGTARDTLLPRVTLVLHVLDEHIKAVRA